jgi:hypothetical protein
MHEPCTPENLDRKAEEKANTPLPLPLRDRSLKAIKEPAWSHAPCSKNGGCPDRNRRGKTKDEEEGKDKRRRGGDSDSEEVRPPIQVHT